MPSNLSRLLSRLYSSLATILVAALLGAATLAAWHFYQEERLRAQLAAEGQHVTVQLARTDRHPRQVWDALGNFVYVGFQHQGRPYEVRCVSPTRWLAAGDQLALRYHPGLDVFGQLRAAPLARRNPGVSRLINWSALPDFSPETRALLLFVLAAGALFFVGSGLLAALPGLGWLSALARPVGAVVLGAGAVFFTYDAAQYYRYAAALQRDGQPLTVAVLRAEEHADRQTTQSYNFHTYTYTATFRHGGREREVAIEEADYARLRDSAGARLAVRYEPTRDDFIAADYSPARSYLLLPLFFWGLLGWALWPAAAGRAAGAPVNSYSDETCGLNSCQARRNPCAGPLSGQANPIGWVRAPAKQHRAWLTRTALAFGKQAAAPGVSGFVTSPKAVF
ncbi:hypothetical protein [Hymenobacter sp.]|uniref:hypothetical protein n=1 Tax=Hymenobacter sp. TaxID=1898978 RepID=UPI00286A48F9|nr:hypothetical protein [Hymenobacter sp.]